MKTVRIAGLALAASLSAAAQTPTIYKHIDDNGHITYTNRPMKGAVAVELEPLTTIPGTPAGSLQRAARLAPSAEPAPRKPEAAVVTPLPRQNVAAVDGSSQKRRDDAERRRTLERELAREERSLLQARAALAAEQQNPELVAAVRAAQQAVDPTPAQLAQFRASIDKASGRIRGLQAIVAEHEGNIEALREALEAAVR